MLRLWNHVERGLVRRYLIAGLVVASFAVMLLGLPLLRWLHLRSVIICPFRALTGLPCPTCGYVREFDLLANGHWEAALRFQPFILFIVLLAGLVAVKSAVSLPRGQELQMPRWFGTGFLMVLGLSWAWNLWFRL